MLETVQFGLIIDKNPIMNSQIPKTMQKYTPYFGEISPMALKTDPYAGKPKVVASPIPNQTGISESLIMESPGPSTEDTSPTTRDSAIT